MRAGYRPWKTARPWPSVRERLPAVHRIELDRLSRREVIAQIRGILDGPGPAGPVEEVAGRSDEGSACTAQNAATSAPTGRWS